MTWEQIDRNTFVSYGKYESKSKGTDLTKRISEFSTNKVLTNNYEYMFNYNLNTPIVGYNTQPDGYDDLSLLVKKTPELIAIIDAFVTDILSDGHVFEGSQYDVDRAEYFYDQNRMGSVLYKWIFDTFIYGNGYLFVNTIPTESVKSIVGKYVGYESKAMDEIIYELKSFVDEIATKNMQVQHIPAITVSIQANDKFGENISYIQQVGTNVVTFNSNEVIQLKDIDLDGKLYGYSRLYALKSELQILAYIKDYFGSFFENNATPDKIFIAKNLQPGTKAYEMFHKQLLQFKRQGTKRRNLLVTSDVTVTDLNNSKDNGEYLQLIQKVTDILAMTFEMPPSRYGATSKATSEEATLSNQGYYRNIGYWQDKIENILNTQFWTPIFNVQFKFNRNYKEDEQREVMIEKTKVDIVQQLLQNGLITKASVPKLLATKLGLDEADFIKNDSVNNDVQSNYMQQNMDKTDMLDESVKKSKTKHTPKKYNVNKKL